MDPHVFFRNRVFRKKRPQICLICKHRRITNMHAHNFPFQDINSATLGKKRAVKRTGSRSRAKSRRPVFARCPLSPRGGSRNNTSERVSIGSAMTDHLGESMHILVTGAAGMIGRKLVERLAPPGRSYRRPLKITQVTLHDLVEPAAPEFAPFPVSNRCCRFRTSG